jgi:hypothetical protein
MAGRGGFAGTDAAGTEAAVSFVSPPPDEQAAGSTSARASTTTAIPLFRDSGTATR